MHDFINSKLVACLTCLVVQGLVQDGRSGNVPESRTILARLAYLIDLQTIRIMDLLTNATLATINHDTRIDWLVRGAVGGP